MKKVICLLAFLCAGAVKAAPYDEIDGIFDKFRNDSHIPGLVYGVVIDGKLAHVAGFGLQELEAKRPVTADSLFRIASMTKAFTALTLLEMRDEGKVRLDDPAENYVPEMRGWRYPTSDSPHIRVRDLATHSAGFVTDDPWGDRQTPMPEADFTELLKTGVPFTRAPETGYEYSNLGFALVGRVVTNVSGKNYADTVTDKLLKPLGMNASSFVADSAPREKRALGYRWEDGTWKAEPVLGPGAFGAMGGLQTSANDYAKWVEFLLSAWPPRDGAEMGPVKRSSVRELSQGLNFPHFRGNSGPIVNYGMGFNVILDNTLGFTMSHSGGYPGFGSHVLLMPERGAAVFAFANRTYAGPVAPVWEAAAMLERAGMLPPVRPQPGSAMLTDGYGAVGAIYKSGGVLAANGKLAMNFLMDRDADGRARDLAALKSQVGDCDTTSPVRPTGGLSGEFTWKCGQGQIKGNLLLAPTLSTQIQSMTLTPIKP